MKKSWLQQANDHLDAEIAKLHAARGALLATQEAITKLRKPKAARKPKAEAAA